MIALVRRLFSRRRHRWIQRLFRVRRIHHPRWSFGWAFPFTTWCRFQAMTMSGRWSDEPPTIKPAHWKRCEPSSSGGFGGR